MDDNKLTGWKLLAVWAAGTALAWLVLLVAFIGLMSLPTWGLAIVVGIAVVAVSRNFL